MTPLFGILQLDRGDPLGYGNVAGLAQAWLIDAGGFAAVGLNLYFLYVLLGQRGTAGAAAGAAVGGGLPVANPLAARAAHRAMSESNRLRMPVTTWMVAMFVLSLICYAGVLYLLIAGKGGTAEPPPPAPGSPVVVPPPVWHGEYRPLLLTVAGLFAILGIGQPFARDLLKLRWRRIWALATLAFKEAAAKRVYWLFLVVALPFLFQNVWLTGGRPVDEFRSLVGVSTLTVTVLALVVGLILAAFSLPADIKNQTIHTVVTKPVERFEVVLGRFLGYAGLMTLALAGMTAACLLFMTTSTIDERAAAETKKARVTARGRLEFSSRKQGFEGTNVGREFDYRKYIAGHPTSPQRGIWKFARVPAGFLDPPGDFVPVEFTFDIFKLTKGEENKGAAVTFRVVSHACPQKAPTPDQLGEWQWAAPPGADGKAPEQAYRDAVAEYQAKGVNPLAVGVAPPRPGEPPSPEWQAVNDLAERFGFYEFKDKEVYDYAVMGVDVPAGLFRNAARGDPDPRTELDKDGNTVPAPRVRVYVKCESPGQLLGMAEPDLYLLEGNQPFAVNFVKGVVGLWCKLCILTGIAVALSTYFSGVLTLLLASLVFGLGYMTDHMNDLAAGRNVGGGPFQTISQLVKTETATAPLADSAGGKTIASADNVSAWFVRRIQNVVPDVESFTWTHFVSEGYNVNAEYLAVNLLVMLGYLVPWFALAYYLMKSREVAS